MSHYQTLSDALRARGIEAFHAGLKQGREDRERIDAATYGEAA